MLAISWNRLTLSRAVPQSSCQNNILDILLGDFKNTPYQQQHNLLQLDYFNEKAIIRVNLPNQK